MIAWFSRKKKTKPASKNDFVSLASHELRSPLSIIKWYTEILLDGDAGPVTEDQRKYLTVIESSNQRAIDLVRSLLNVSRIDLDTFSVFPEPLSLSEVVTSTQELFSKDISKKHLDVTYEEGSGVSMINADKHICFLIVKHLLSNAIMFSKVAGTIRVVTSLVPRHSKAGNVFTTEESILLTVADTGLGIPEKDKDKIFSRMFRASNVKDSEGSDSGLGLYITKRVIDITDGNIWFESVEGTGTTFYVTFKTKGMKKKEGTTVLE